MDTPTTITRRAALAGLASIPLAIAAGAAAVADTGTGAGAAAAESSGRRIFIAGDSTAAPKDVDARPETGWGMALPFYLATTLTLDNRARNGRSSKSFVDEGRLADILDEISEGDVLLIQFGHNDSKTDEERYTEPWSTYQEYLSEFVTGARDRGAVPVLATSIERRRFDDDGNATSSHGDYPDAMRELAVELDVPLVDTQAETIALWQELGEEGTADYFNGDDNTHLAPRGAAAVAAMVAADLRDVGVLEASDVRQLDDVPADDWFTWLPEQPD